MLRLMSFVAVALIVDISFLGPLGLTVYDISVRKVLIAILVLGSIVPTLSQKPVATWQIALLSCTMLYLIIWGGIVPMINGVNLKMTVAEVQPFVGLLLILPFYHLFRYYGTEFYLKILRRCMVALALIVIVVWAASNIFGMAWVGVAMRRFYISLNDTDLGVYIGPMPDGSFRVMLINFILFPIMLCYYNWKKTNFAWSAFYGFAIFATGTRAFLGVGALIVGISLVRSRPVLAVPIVAVVAGLAVLYMGDLERFRVFEFSSELTSGSARYVQFFSLMNLFWEYPIFGAGFGANAVVIRSIEAPYSYELTYVALLAKVGFVGAGIVVGALTVWTFRLMRTSPNWTSIASLIIAIVLMTASNPYLINLVGMTIIAAIIAIGAQQGAVAVRKKYPALSYRSGLPA